MNSFEAGVALGFFAGCFFIYALVRMEVRKSDFQKHE